MAKLITLGTAVSATSVAAQTAVSTTASPFAPGFNAVVHICSTGLTGTPTIKVQTSEDGTTWTDAVTVSVITRNHVMAEVELKKYARLNVTVAGSAGTLDAYIHD
jgi:hypothetical protein